MNTVQIEKGFKPMNNVVSKKVGNASWQVRLEAATLTKLTETIAERYPDSNSKNADFVKEALEALSKVATLENEVADLKQQLKDKDAQINDIKDAKEIYLEVDELTEVNNAVEASNMTREQITKIGLLAECKKINKQSKKLEDVDINKISDVTGKKTTLRGSAELRIKATVEAIMEYNNNQTEKGYKYFISPSLVAEVSGSNRKAIKEFFDSAYKNDIETHNQKHELSTLDNRKHPSKFPSDAKSLRVRFGLD